MTFEHVLGAIFIVIAFLWLNLAFEEAPLTMVRPRDPWFYVLWGVTAFCAVVGVLFLRAS